MGLVNYSDSDSSDNDNNYETKLTVSAKRNSPPAFQKLVNKSNPGKIRVSFPKISQKDEEHDEPPFKKMRSNERTPIDFNSLLPAPKRSGPKITALEDCNTRKDTVSGVSLMTGTEIGHSKELHRKGEHTSENISVSIASLTGSKDVSLPERNTSEIKPIAKPLMFKPLCVMRKTTHEKKKISPKSDPSTHLQAQKSSAPAFESTKPAKISLFSTFSDVEDPSQRSMEEYQPLVFTLNHKLNEATNQASDCEVESPHQDIIKTESNTDSLSSIADSLRLSSSERRQLFGRQIGKNEQNTEATILNFSTDMEYLHNEKLRAAGEQIVHNPVRAIAPGKHSLKQLVNAVQSQKDALEDSFAKGKNNRAEASSKYGW